MEIGIVNLVFEIYKGVYIISETGAVICTAVVAAYCNSVW
jgi:hypothetical protein